MRLGRLSSALLVLSLLALPGTAAGSAAIGFSANVDASDLSGPLLLTVPAGFGDIPIRAYNALDNGAGTATSIDGFASLAGVDPADVTIAFGDVERVSTTFTPGGCAPSPPPGFSNCATASNTYGDGDAGPSFFDVILAGTGTILSGEALLLVTTVDSDLASPGFATASAEGSAVITGGLAPYFDEILALTNGTGIGQITTGSFDPVCIPGTDPCAFAAEGVVTFVPEPFSGLLLTAGLWLASGSRRPRRSGPILQP